MRIGTTLAVVFFLIGSAYAAPFGKTVRAKSQLGGVSRPPFKKLKSAPKIPDDSFLSIGNFNEPSSLLYSPQDSPEAGVGMYLGGGELLGSSHKWSLESQYADYEKADPRKFADPQTYGRILKSASVGLAYPLTRKLTLDGRYALIKGDSMQSLSPYLGATYRFNAATSISLSYRQNHDEQAVRAAAQKDDAAAELKIHF